MAWPRNRTAAPGVRRSRRRRATLRPDGMVGVELERAGNRFLPADGRSGDGRVDCVPTDWRDTDPIGQRARRLTVGPHRSQFFTKARSAHEEHEAVLVHVFYKAFS